MSTPAQILANRENAQLSTGLQTDEGKAKVSQNARSHGATAKKAVVLEDEQEEYAQFVADFELDLQPDGALQLTLFASIVDAAWRLRRLRLAEVQLQDELPDRNDPLLIEDCHKKLQLYALYTQRAERSLYKAIAELRKVQTENQYRYESQATSETEPTMHTQSPLIDFHRICPIVGRKLERDIRNDQRNAEAELLAYLNAPLPRLKPTAVPNEKTKPFSTPAAAAAAR